VKRIQYHHYGGPEVLRLENFEPPRPGKDQVLVRVRAATANAMDWKIRNGEMRVMTSRGFPRGVGNDFARLAAEGKLGIPVARTAPLADAIPALTALERHHTPKGGKLVITAG
jgi:hypothetical protein